MLWSGLERHRSCHSNEMTLWPILPVSLMFLTHFDVFCDQLLNRPTTTWNLFVFSNDRKRRKTDTHTCLVPLDCWRICARLGSIYSQTRSSVPVANKLMNSLMEKWFRLLIQSSIHKMNNPTVKLDLDSIMKCWFGLWTKLPCEQRLHFRGMNWRAKSSYFSHASSYRENVASARRVEQNLPVLYSCLLCSIVFASFHVALFMTSLILTNLIATFVPVAKTMASDPEG